MKKKKPHKEVLAIILKVTLSHCNETTQYKNKNKSVKKKGIRIRSNAEANSMHDKSYASTPWSSVTDKAILAFIQRLLVFQTEENQAGPLFHLKYKSKFQLQVGFV